MASDLTASGFVDAAARSARVPNALSAAGLGLRGLRRALLSPREADGERRRRRASLPLLLRDRDGV